MRQTIDCYECATKHHSFRLPKNGIYGTRRSPTEDFSFIPGFLRRTGLVCDACNDPLSFGQMVVCVGSWDDRAGIPNIRDWHLPYIRPATKGEIDLYCTAALSARELREDEI
jgi:hypothetical protein